MKNIAKRLIRVLSMDFIRTLDAKIQRRRTVWRVGNADIVVIADFGGFGISRVRALVTLTYERDEVI